MIRQRVKISPLGWRLLGVLMELGEDDLLTLCNSVRADTTQSVATLRELVSAGLVCGSKHRLTSGRSWFEEVGTTEATAFLEAAAKNIRAAMAAWADRLDGLALTAKGTRLLSEGH